MSPALRHFREHRLMHTLFPRGTHKGNHAGTNNSICVAVGMGMSRSYKGKAWLRQNSGTPTTRTSSSQKGEPQGIDEINPPIPYTVSSGRGSEGKTELEPEVSENGRCTQTSRWCGKRPSTVIVSSSLEAVNCLGRVACHLWPCCLKGQCCPCVEKTCMLCSLLTQWPPKVTRACCCCRSLFLVTFCPVNRSTERGVEVSVCPVLSGFGHGTPCVWRQSSFSDLMSLQLSVGCLSPVTFRSDVRFIWAIQAFLTSCPNGLSFTS